MKQVFCISVFLVFCLFVEAQQNVGIGTNSPHSSALLDISSTSKGMLVPKMNKVQRNAIASAAKGLLVFVDDVDSVGFHYYDGSQWLWLEALANAGWKTKGNAGTDTAINFFGTTDNMPIRFKQNGQHLGQWDLGKSNYYIGKNAGKNNVLISTFSIGIGDSALFTNTSASHNLAIGFKALKKNQFGSNNIALGSFALESLQGTGFGGNTVIGVSALRNAKNPQFNTAIGTSALQEHRDSSSNTAIGFQSLTLDTTGSRNVAIGSNALARNANGSRNVTIGHTAGFNNSSGTRNTFIGNGVNASQTAIFNYDPIYTGSNNTAVGSLSFFNNISGNENIAMGDSALLNNSTGSNNIVIGSNSFLINTTGNNNTIIGNEADALTDGLFNASAIGANARVDNSNTMVLGSVSGVNGATADIKVGIGTNAPANRLHIVNSKTNDGGWSDGIVVENISPLATAGEAGLSFRNTMIPAGKQWIIGMNQNPQLAFNYGATFAGSTTRMAIDTFGNVGVGTTTPAALLDVDGTTKLGTNGTALTEIIKLTVTKDVIATAAGSTSIEIFTVPNAQTGSTVFISPASALTSGLVIAYARVSSAGNVEVKFTNTTGSVIDPPSMNYFITIIK